MKKNPDVIEEFKISGKDIIGPIKKRIDDILKKNQATRIVVRDEKGMVLLNISLAATVSGLAFAFIPAIIGSTVSLMKGGSISVEFLKK